MGSEQKVDVPSGREGKSKVFKNGDVDFATLFDSTFEGIIVHAQGTILYVNQAFVDLFGYTRSELIATSGLKLIAEESRAIAQEKVRIGDERAYEAKGLRKDGSSFSVEVKGKEVDIGGQAMRVSACRDLSRHEQVIEAVIESERRFRAIADTATDAIFSINPSGEIAFANEAATALFDYGVEELVGQNITRLMPESIQAAHSEALAGYLGGREPKMIGKTVELTARKRDGTVFPIELSLATWGSDNKTYFTGIIRDITDREQAKHALEDSERRYRTLVENSSECICKIDLDGRFRYMSPCGLKSRGLTDVDEIKGVHCRDFVEPAHHQVIDKTLADARKGVEQKFEYESRTTDGIRWFESVLSPQLDTGGRVVGFIRLSRDISDRKAAKSAQEDSEKRYRTLVENSSECICNIDLDGRFRYMSPCGLKSHGLSDVDKITGVHCKELIEPAHHQLIEQTLAEAKKGFNQKFEYESDTTSGIRWFESILSPQRDSSGAIVGFIRVSRDVTDRKEATDKLGESWERLRRTLEGTVDALSSTAGLRDPYTAGHQRRVATLATAIAKEMAIDPDQVEGVRVASTLHDIGKIYVPAEILSKPGSISEFEFKIIQGHAQASYDILKGIEFPWPVAKAVLQHHERIDGSGYPDGLYDGEIITEARIIAVADVVEAMSSRRPYRAGLGINRALEEISRNSDTLYDATASEACINLFEARDFDFRGHEQTI